MRSAVILSTCVAALSLALASCQPRKPRYADSQAQADRPQLTQHWIYDDQLRSAMREIERLSRGTAVLGEDGGIPAAMAAEFGRMEEYARRLSAAAEGLSEATGRIRLAGADQDAFLDQARSLQKQAQSLGRAAEQRNALGLRRHLDAITTTCISCHTRFRDFTGELAPPRA